MKTGIQLVLLALAFACGWVLRGAQPPVTQLEPDSATQQQALTANKANELEQNVRASKASDQSVQEAFGEGLNESLLLEFEQLLFSGQFNQASAIFRRISSQLQPVDIEFLGALFTTYVIQFGLDEYQSSFSLMNIEAQLSSLDNYSPSSQFFDVLDQADLNPLAALAAYDELLSYYQEQVTSSQLKHLENWLISQVEKNLRAQRDWQGLESWYKALISRSSAPDDLYRRLAVLYFDMGRHLESLDILDKLAAVASWNRQDEQLYQANKVEVGSDSVEAIALQRAGEHFIVNIGINNRVNAAMLLDTGASISGLGSRFVSSQGFNPIGRKIRLTTAGGSVDADLIRLNSVIFGNNEFFDLDVASIALSNTSGSSRYQGLLGMDVLGRFKFYLDQRQAILYLRSGSDFEGPPPEF